MINDVGVKYSFIVPVYNVESYLNKCIDSIINQTASEIVYEIILVDDGSTDSSGSICDNYSRRYDHVISIHRENAGLLMTRRVGLEHSTGKYVLFVDSDDYVEDNLLEVVDRYIESFGPDFLNYGFIMESDNKAISEPITEEAVEILDTYRFLKLFISTEKFNSVCSKVIKGDILREYVDEIYNLGTNTGEDKLQTAYLIKYSNKIVFLRECLYHYVMRHDSIAHKKSEKDLYDIISVYGRVESVLQEISDFPCRNTVLSEDFMSEYRNAALNETLDHIYKYNKRRDVSKEDKLSALKGLYERNRSFFVIHNTKHNRVKAYNKIRFGLMEKGLYSALIELDYLLSLIRRIL